MKVADATLYALSIPFKGAFRHSLATREACDSIIVKVVLDNGAEGFGECVPRPYVTGETVASCMRHIQRKLLPAIRGQDFRPPDAALSCFLSDIDARLPCTGGEGVIAFNAAKAGVEIALLDALFKSAGRSLRDLLPPVKESVTYSAVIAAVPDVQAGAIAEECARQGINQVKIKVGSGDDRARVAAVRAALGKTAALRVDANGAFDVPGALRLISVIAPFNIVSVEQPIPRGDLDAMARVKSASPIPLMADESVVTEQDATDLISKRACDLFNLRLSKNGGCARTLRLAQMARTAGIGIQLGCQVGETAILSAVGRHLAAHIGETSAVEGSYGSLLLIEDLSMEPVRFGRGGTAPLLGGPGIGIRVREDVLEKYAEKTARIPMVAP